MRKWPRPPAKSTPIPLNPEEWEEICLQLEREFEDIDEVLIRFEINLPGWARLEFDSAEKMKREMSRKYAPLLDTISRYRVRLYDERRWLEIDYRRRWLLESLSIRADAKDADWPARAIEKASRVLEKHEEQLLRSDFLVLLQGVLWLTLQSFSGASLVYLWNTDQTDLRLLWAGAAAFSLAVATFAPGLLGRMFPPDTEAETGSPLRLVMVVTTVLSSIAAAVVAILGMTGG